MDIVAGVSAVTNAIGLAKTLREIDRQLDIAEMKAKVADILINLSDAKIALLESKEALALKDAEIVRLRRAHEQRSELIEGDGGYWYKVSENGLKTGFPICPKCIETDSRQVTLLQNGDVRSAKCPVCSTQFKPVTSYLESGGTLHEQLVERRRQATERQSRALASTYRSSWGR